MATYSIEDMHGTEICTGISNIGLAQERAQELADRKWQIVYLYGDDLGDESVEFSPAITAV